MLQIKKGSNQEMDDLLNCKEASSITREGADVYHNKSESKTTLGFSNQQIPLKTNYFPYVQINQTQVATSSLSSPLENQSKIQDGTQKQFFPQNQQNSAINSIEFAQCQIDPLLFQQQQQYNMHPQFMNPIHFQSQKQLQTFPPIFQNSNQLYQQSNIPYIQTIQPSPFQPYQVIYNPFNVQQSHFKGQVHLGQACQINGHLMMQNSNVQNNIDNWQINSKISSKQRSQNLQEQMSEIQLSQQQNINNSINQQINNKGTLLIDNQQKNIEQISTNKQAGQICLLQNEQEQNQSFNLSKKEVQLNQRKNNSLKTDQNSSKWNNCLVDEQNIQIESYENNNNINHQFKRNRYQNLQQERIGVQKDNINRNQDLKDSQISIERINSQKTNQSSIDQKEKFKSKTCSFRSIKKNNTPSEQTWQILSSFMPQQIEMSTPCSQKGGKNIWDLTSKEEVFKIDAYSKSSQIKKSLINEKNITYSKINEIQSNSSKDSILLKKRKHNESQIQNVDKFSLNNLKKIQLNEQDKSINSQYYINCTHLGSQQKERNSLNSQNSYSSGQNSQKDQQISAINSSLHNTRMINKQPELKQKSQSDHISTSSLEGSPIQNQYILRQKTRLLPNSEQYQQGLNQQDSNKKEHQKKNLNELDEIKEDHDFLQEAQEDDQWEDSFFQQMKTSTKTGGKSFFLISNYKKKLFQQLDPEDQEILTQMKQSKKFNFSKNVIKQFLKVMNSEVNYVYKISSNYSSLNKHELIQNCKQPVQNKNNYITNSQSNNNQPEFNFKQNNKIDQSLKNYKQHFIESNNQFSTLSSNQKSNYDNNQQNRPVQLSNSIASVQKEKVYEKILNPSRYQLNQLRDCIREFLTFHSYTHSSIKKILIHNYYSLYFKDFLENHCNEWVESGKTKYKEEQKIMISFLKLCLRNRKLLIFLSQHDQLKEQEQY